MEVARRLGARGWLTLAWPREYGGLAASYMKQLIYKEEVAYHRVPGTEMGVGGVSWVGPALMLYGTDAQKREHLLPIAQGQRLWCTGYSEPGAGSDVASLQTRAVRNGDDYIINGQKIWTSAAHVAHWCWLAARTEPQAPKHRGMSLFLVDMKSPGITVSPLVNMAGVHSFNQVFFDDVRVPRENLVGEENRGWYQMAVALDFERSGVGRAASARRTWEELIDYVKDRERQGTPHCNHANVRHRLAELAVEIEVCRLLAYGIAWAQSQGRIPHYEATMAKLFGSELGQRVARVGMDVLGLYGPLKRGSLWAVLRGRLEHLYRASISDTIAAGTSEIMRNIIATRGLGLPR